MVEYLTIEQLDFDNYPLPIAYELQQLAGIPRGEWRYKCEQLARVFEFALRYCTVIALSEYRTAILESSFRSADVDALIADTIDDPTLEICAKLLKEIMGIYRGRQERLVVPELYEFCYTTGELESASWDIIEQLKTLSTRVEDRRVTMTYEVRLSGWYTEYLPVVGELLNALDFLKKYDLLRLVDCKGADDTYIWVVRILKGPNLNPPLNYLPGQDRPFEEEHTLALWNHDQQCPLYLLPFAIFHDCGTPPPNDRQAFFEDFFYYEKYEHSEMTYVGLRDNEDSPDLPGRPHRITLQEYVDIIESFRQEADPMSSKVEYWPQLVRRCSALSWDQLRVFQRDKYDPGVYIRRSEIEAHFQEFVEGGKIGFLVVGDSGTGKTNLLCSLAERLLEEGNAVILYNCADIRDKEPDIGQILEQSLRLSTSISDFLLTAENSCNMVKQLKLVCLFDAVNEAKNPLQLLVSLVNLVRDIAVLELQNVEVRIVLSFRSESWMRLKASFVGDRYFYQANGEVAMHLERFGEVELENVYKQYERKYRLQTDFEELTGSVKSFIQDPLMMRFLAESFYGQELPPDPKTRRVFESYIRVKIGYQEESRLHEHIEEKRFVERLVTKMLELEQEELDIKSDLRSDPELRQQMLDPKLTSPYMQLRDKGVLTAFGRQDLTDRSPQKVKFTYDRVFEYLLQAHLFPSKLTVGDVDTIVEQIHRSRSFLSLWGAVRVALQMYFDEQSPENAPVLTELSIMADSQIRAMMIDMLTEYGLDQREKVQTYLLETLLPLKSEEAGQIVVQVAYELALVDALEECLVHLSRLVKQLATQNVFYLWQQIPDKGAIIVTRLYERIEAQWRNILASVLGNFLQGARGVEMITGLVPFLDLFALFIGYAYMAGPEIQPIGKVLGKFIFLISSGPLAPFVKRFLQRWGEQIAVRIAQAAPIYGAKLLRVIFDYPTNHPLRKSIGDFAEYADPRVPIPQHVLDQMFDVAQEPVGTPMFVIASIFYPRGKDLDNVFSFCKRLFFEGNIYSKNLALRIASLIVYMEELGGEYVEFVEQMLLELWNGQEATYRYPIKEDADSPVIEVDIPVGNLHAPVLYECRTKTGGASEFIEKILQLPWHGDPSQRIIRVLECLEDVILLAGATKRTSIRPVLETLRRDEWMGHEDPAVRTALVDLLSYARSFHPTEVDQFLDSLLTEPGNGYESSDKPSTQLVRDVYERFKLRPLSELFVGSFLVGVPWLQQNSELFRSLISTQVYRESALGEHIDWDDVMATLGRGVGSFEMLEEITGLLSTKL